MQARHIMAGMVKWKLVSCGQLDHTGIASERLLLRYNQPNCHRPLYTGHFGNHSFISPFQTILRPKIRQHVTAKVQSKDTDETSSSKFPYEDNDTFSSAYQRNDGNQLRALESYFSKLNPPKGQQLCSLPQKNSHTSGISSSNEAETSIANDDDSSMKRLDSTQVNFNRGNAGTKSYHSMSTDDYKNLLMFDEDSFLDMHKDDDTSNFCLTNLLAGINIAVLLFETASTVKDSDYEYLSLPLMYGAKINNLILSGEWWRLLTPMCLHSGFLHAALGCWVLLTFGPRVCRGYGQIIFFLIYVLGGVFGNLTSFVHTPELTVCGTGPVFSLIGAWLVYQSQNKQFIDKDVSESMFWQAVVAAALSFLLSIFGRIDNWAHLGATIAGVFFGYLTCPIIELDNAAKNGQKESVALVRRQTDPCKATAIFTVSTLVGLALAFGTQLNVINLE